MGDIKHRQAEAMSEIYGQLDYAMEKHPVFCSKGTHDQAIKILTEEYVEVLKSSNDFDDGKGALEDVRVEIAQMGAVIIRTLADFDDLI